MIPLQSPLSSTERPEESSDTTIDVTTLPQPASSTKPSLSVPKSATLKILGCNSRPLQFWKIGLQAKIHVHLHKLLSVLLQGDERSLHSRHIELT
jgi:hypothetical protein